MYVLFACVLLAYSRLYVTFGRQEFDGDKWHVSRCTSLFSLHLTMRVMTDTFMGMEGWQEVLAAFLNVLEHAPDSIRDLTLSPECAVQIIEHVNWKKLDALLSARSEMSKVTVLYRAYDC